MSAIDPTPQRLPYSWAMTDPSVLAHRFATPCELPLHTAASVRTGQRLLTVVGGVTSVRDELGPHLLTGNVSHSIEEAAHIISEGGEPCVVYDAEVILFDVRPRLWPQALFSLRAANGEATAVRLLLSYHVQDVLLFNGCGVTYRPAGEGSEIRCDDPKITAVFQQAICTATHFLQQQSVQLPDAEAVRHYLSMEAAAVQLNAMVNRALTPLGLQLNDVLLSSVGMLCPYCARPLTMAELETMHCRKPDCDRRLHACPKCGQLISTDCSACSRCKVELLWCGSCRQYRRGEEGRFCPVCRRACYPWIPRDL